METKKAKLAGRWVYFRKESDGKWHRIDQATYEASKHDHRSNPGGAYQRHAPTGPVSSSRGPGLSTRIAPSDDDDDDDDLDDDGYGVAGDYLGDDPVITPQQEQMIMTAMNEKAVRDQAKVKAGQAKVDQGNDLAKKASNPAAAVYDYVKDTAKKALTPKTATPDMVADTITPMQILVGGIILVAIVKGRRRR